MRDRFVETYRWIKHYNIVLGSYFRKPEYSSKVFCIGYNKTGTTSFGQAMQLLNYRHSTFNKVVWRKYYNKNKIDKVLQFTAKFDSVDDLPWLKEDMIPVLDKAFPDSKFVYLTRDEKSWKKSLYNWTHKTIGEYPNIEERIEDYRKHGEFVLDYFKNRPKEDFIILDIRDPKGFAKLAKFLGKESNIEAFPHKNKT